MMIAEFTAVLFGLFLFSTAVGTQDFVQEFLSLFSVNKTRQSRHYIMVTAISALVMPRTVQLLNTHDACVLLNCPRAEIRAVDSQSHLRILL